jgi:predicted Zn-dependent peptidase
MMVRRLVVALALTLGLAIAAPAAEPFTPANPRTMTFPPLAFTLPTAQEATLSNGIRVFMVHNPELPLVNLTALIDIGSIYEPAGKTGLAGLTGAVMRSGGTRDLTAEKLDEELEFMASSVEGGVGADAGSLSAATLSRNLDRTLEIFSQVLTAPVFREDRVTIAKNRTLESIRRQNDDPKNIGDRELHKALYAGHPLGEFPTLESVGAISRDDLVAFHRRYVVPGSIILAVSGDFDRTKLLARLEKLLGGWKGKADTPAVAPPAAEVKPEVLYVRKDVNQSVIRMGHMGIDKSNPDLYAVRVLDYIMGGGFTSRMTTEIRSNQGLAYNVEASFDVGRRFIGTFQAETETKSGSTAKAIGLMRDIMATLTKEPVTDQELSLAKDAIINSFIFGFAKASDVVNQRARLAFYGYPKGYLENYRDNIAKVTKEDVLRVAKKYLHPDKLVITVVGDDKGFDKPLSTFGAVREIKLDNGR